jgi:hypothetical protein
MRKQLFLLAGLHKTATSSIQDSCVANAQLFEAAGFAYPIVHEGDRRDGNHTRFLKKLFRRDPYRGGLSSQLVLEVPPQAPLTRDQHRARFAKALQGQTRLLMAAEGVSTFTADELAELKGWFEAQGWDVRVLCHVRHISSWVNSMVGQRVISAFRLPIASAVGEFNDYGSLVRRRIENIRQVFPDAEFHSHEEAQRHPDGPVGFFLARIGFDPPAGFRYIRTREGKSDKATRVFSLVNERFGPYRADGQPNPAVFADPAVLGALLEIKGRKFSLRPAEVAPIQALMHEENEWLRDTLGEPFFDTRMHFEETRCDWDEQSAAALRKCLHAMPEPVRAWVRANLPRLDLRGGPRQ